MEAVNLEVVAVHYKASPDGMVAVVECVGKVPKFSLAKLTVVLRDHVSFISKNAAPKPVCLLFEALLVLRFISFHEEC